MYKNNTQQNSDLQDVKSMLQHLTSKFETEGKKEAIATTYLSVDEACEFMKVCRKTLYKYYIKDRTLPYIKLGRRVLFKLTDLNFFIESRKL
jgi:excisionase family DNA binding protein